MGGEDAVGYSMGISIVSGPEDAVGYSTGIPTVREGKPFQRSALLHVELTPCGYRRVALYLARWLVYGIYIVYQIHQRRL